MNINLNIKSKFTVNNKKYDSVDEMPADVRVIYEKVMATQSKSGNKIFTTQTKIVFNGVEYNSLDEMPEDARGLYEKTMAAVRGKVDINILKGAGETQAENTPPARQRLEEFPRRGDTPASSSGKRIIAFIILLIVGIMLYYILKKSKGEI